MCGISFFNSYLGNVIRLKKEPWLRIKVNSSLHNLCCIWVQIKIMFRHHYTTVVWFLPNGAIGKGKSDTVSPGGSIRSSLSALKLSRVSPGYNLDGSPLNNSRAVGKQ